VPVKPRLLGPRRLRHAVLARQLLLERASLPLPRVLERVAGLQCQYAPATYVGLWSRVDGFRRDDLTRALEARTVVQASLMRATIHLVSAADYWPLALAIRAARRRWWLQSDQAKLPQAAIERAAGRVREALRAQGTLRRKELDRVAGKEAVGGVSMWLDLVRVPPSGTWEHRPADLFAAAEDWLGPPPALTADAAVDHLVRRYLTGFGPATVGEVANWAGLGVREVAPSLERLTLRRFVTDDGQVLVDLPRLPLPDPEGPAPVRFLSTWEAVLLAHARRAGVLREEDRPQVFRIRNPHSVNTFLVDGEVAGTWRYEGGAIAVAPFRPLGAGTLREVEEEADRLAAFHA